MVLLKKTLKYFYLKKSRSSSDRSNSPRSTDSNSPIGSKKKKSKSDSKEKTRSPCSKKKKKKDGLSKAKEASFEVYLPSPDAKKPAAETQPPWRLMVAPESNLPILASSLGLNRIKTRSGPLPQANFFEFVSDEPIPVVPCRYLPKLGTRWASGLSSGNAKKEERSSKREVESSLGHMAPDSGTGQFKVSPSHSGPVGSSELCTPEHSYGLENPKESESPRYQALLRMTSAPKFPGDIKSFSHELNSKGVRPFPLRKPRRSDNVEEISNIIRTKFDKAKEEVNSDLVVFVEDLLPILKGIAESDRELKEQIEELLVLAHRCARTTPRKFWLRCEGIVQELDDKRQELPPGMVKQLHNRMLFILTRCTRLLQFHKESQGEEEEVVQLHQSRVLHSATDKRVPTGEVMDGRDSSAAKTLKAPSTKKDYSQEQRGLNSEEEFACPAPLSSPFSEPSKNSELLANIDRMSSCKSVAVSKDQNDGKVEPPELVKNQVATSDDTAVAKPQDSPPEDTSKHRRTISWGYWWENQLFIYEGISLICRICEEEVSKSYVKVHSIICKLADRCVKKGMSVDERLVAVAVVLENVTEYFIQKGSLAGEESPDGMKISSASLTEESDVLFPELSDFSQRGLEDMLDCFPEADNSALMDNIRCSTSMSCRTGFGPKADQGMATSSTSSMTPRSPIPTPILDPIELLLGVNGTLDDQDDIPQMIELADIARWAANAIPDDGQSVPLLLSCLEDLRAVIDSRKFDMLVVETLGTRIEKLIQEKYFQLCELLDDEKADPSSTLIDEEAPLEDDVVRSLRTIPVYPPDRTSIDDFEIIKAISKGAFGRVFLAKKRTTGDLFAIKVLKKADMIRKNAVESILTERDILINARNPFVVRFFYSFTCPENLYLVMEYVNGGDFFSMLGNVGRVDENSARVYIAEVILALEYLHSQGVVHRDLKPDNLLIAYDGHVKLTDFGLSKVGLIDSTDDLSGPLCSGTSLLVEEKPNLPTAEHQLERRVNRSAVGTPDYLAPEILLGTRHGASADWWSVGIILFELIAGVPPFNADNPQKIFDNILNRNIPWPSVPEEMSHEAHDLIDRLLTEDPRERLGARGAAEVKQHIFFKDINWDNLDEQEVAFVPNLENALDTSYFQSRLSWNPSDEQCFPTNENGYISDGESSCGSICCSSNHHNKGVDERGRPAEFESDAYDDSPFNNFSFKNLSQLAFINCDLMSKCQSDETQPKVHRS